MMRRGCDSEYGPSSAQLAEAVLDGAICWLWYAAGAGAAHVWSDAEVDILAGGGLELSLPCVVPPLDLSTNPYLDYLAGRARALRARWSPVVLLDTEHVEESSPRLVPYVDGWNAAAEMVGDPKVVYGGGGYVGSAQPMWIWPKAIAVPPMSAAQVDSRTYSGLLVDLDLFGDQFPLSRYQGEPMSAYGADQADEVTADRDERRCVIRDWWSRYRTDAVMTDAQVYVAMLTWAAKGGEATRQAIVDRTIP